ncbi:reverse transcriptase domain-containing protein [Clostridium estertheticum]|uniref:reverse transcriptase domain-containing protein n=1 Tax=Clostridium estertheticum TaxID=238834 RepID=UPI001CF10749|nr:reverse transcriptase domain-containing protein [Clostridium estertheticum]MCB2358671.1 Reverse transcriptase (RNA-dependent DNA polymerase) [Clostridium estertheticum]
MNGKTIFKNKYYTHLDIKKDYLKYEKMIKDAEWIKTHGFYPFIHYKIIYNKYIYNKENNTREKKEKIRKIFYSSHIDRYIYQYYGQVVNNAYDKLSVEKGINKVATAYRDNLKGKCNIHFAKEALEFISKCGSAFVFIGDFTSFFDNLDHEYLKEKIKQVLKVNRITVEQYSIYKSITKYTFVELEDIEKEKGKKSKEMRGNSKYFDTAEFRQFKKRNLKRNDNNYGIPQGSAISSVYSNVYMIDFDIQVNNFVTSRRGLYRRYCDDLIIIIPMNEMEINENKYMDYVELIDEIRKSVPRLDLNSDKTEQFIYNASSNRKLINLKGGSNILNYLGFSFDGEVVRIREKSLFKYYCRAYKKVETVKRYKGKINEYAIKKSLYQLYTHLGDYKYSKGYGNFITYVRKSEEIFNESRYLKNKIHDQIKRHWQKINKRLQE